MDYIQQKRLQAFEKFLKEHNALEKFFINYNKLYSKIANRLSSGVIDNSFKWSQTEEGHAFWSRLNNLWIEVWKKQKL